MFFNLLRFVCTEHGIPTSVDFNGCDPAHMVASFNGGDVAIYDLETSQTAVVLKGQGDGSKFRAFADASGGVCFLPM